MSAHILNMARCTWVQVDFTMCNRRAVVYAVDDAGTIHYACKIDRADLACAFDVFPLDNPSISTAGWDTGAA